MASSSGPKSQYIKTMDEVNVSQDAAFGPPTVDSDHQALTVELLRQLLVGQQKQNQLLEEMISQVGAAQRQRSNEIAEWKKANPRLARRCRDAAEVLANVQAEYLQNLTEEVSDNSECFMDGEFMLNEFVDRFGPRLAHLNGVIQVLTQLSSVPNPTPTQ